MKTLYRAYRPQNFKEIVSQNHIKITLQHEIALDRMAHAYIFCGPRGIGKTTIARIFAKSLNCENRKSGEYEPCNSCDMCKDLVAGRSLDVIEIDAASHTGVDNVRENIISVARVAPTRGKYKIFIIDEVHMLSIPAFNALLKLLEEPPGHTIFILCTTEIHKIPDTIISRTERFDFKRISASEIVKKLQYICLKEKIKIDDIILENIARQSGGHMRDAESLLGQVVSIGGNDVSVEEADLVIPRSDIKEVINLIDYLSKKDVGSAIGLINQLLDDGLSLKRFLLEAIELLRKIMLGKIDQGLSEKFGLELGESMELKATELGMKLKLDYIIRIIEKFSSVRNEMKGVFIEQLPLEIAIAELCIADLDNAKSKIYNFQKDQGVSRPSNLAAQPKVSNFSVTSKVNPPIQTQDQKSSSNLNSPITNLKSEKNIDLNKDQIYAKWNEVLTKVKTHNHSLSFILKACQPKDLNGNKLCLAFKYKFHKERIGETNIKQIVENVLREVYGQTITIETIVDESMKVEDKHQNDTVSPNVQSVDAANEIATPKVKNENEEKSTESNNKTDEDMLTNVLKTFGGKVV